MPESNYAQGRQPVLYDCTVPDLGSLERVSDGENCVASYVNFLVVNGSVIIPKLGDQGRDAQALCLFRELFPDRKVVQIYINTLPCIGGGIHCATQQVPIAS
jgi:agmatine deiminase